MTSTFDIVVAFSVRAFLPHKIEASSNAGIASTKALSGMATFLAGGYEAIGAGTVVIRERCAGYVAINFCHRLPQRV